MYYSATRAPRQQRQQQERWEIWCWAPESDACPTGLRMPVAEAGVFDNERAAERQALRLKTYLREGAGLWAADVAGLLACAEGVPHSELPELLAVVDTIRALGADPARVFVTATRCPADLGDSDNWVRPPWEESEWVGGPDDDDDDPDDTDIHNPELLWEHGGDGA